MKTYDINSKADICTILVNNNIKHLNNAFEIPFKNIKKFSKQPNRIGMDLIIFDADVIPLTMQQSNSSFSLIRENSINYFVSFVNIKNENKEYLSVLMDSLSQDYRFLITDGVVLKTVSSFHNDKLTVAIRPENNSSIFLFKYEKNLKSLEYLNSLVEKNLSKITDCGVYSLFGCIMKIIKYTDEELMLIRMQCCDKCVVKIRKYPEFVREFKNISKKEIITGVKYDFSSNSVDILIEKPCTDFTTLTNNRRICLNKVVATYSNDLKMFLLHANGKANNLKAEPLETCNVKSLRPPDIYFPIPNELKPKSQPKTKQISLNEKSVSKNKYQSSNTNAHIFKNTKILPLSIKQNKSKKLLSSSSDDDANLSLCQNLLKSKCNFNINTSLNNCSPDKKPNVRSINNKVQKCNTSTPKKKENSPDSTNGSCSPPFFKNLQMYNTNQLNKIKSTISYPSNNTLTRTTQYIGPCRLLLAEPNIDNIVCGYCTKCLVFIQQTLLIKSNIEKYRCPKCSNIVSLTLFFKMIFLYGSNEHHAIEVCCYNENAERVLKKLLKKNMKFEDYLTSSNNRKLFNDAVKLLIRNRTKMNIVVCHSPNDNINILQSIDTEFIVTTPIN